MRMVIMRQDGSKFWGVRFTVVSGLGSVRFVPVKFGDKGQHFRTWEGGPVDQLQTWRA